MEVHFDQFKPSYNEGLNSFTHAKPFGELLLVFYSFSANKFKVINPSFYKWIKTYGEAMFNTAEQFGKNINWERLPDQILLNQEIGSALLVFPAVEAIAGRPTSWNNHVRNIFFKTLTAESLPLKFVFAYDVAGIASCYNMAMYLLLSTIQNENEELLSTSTLYLVTHYIFFASKMGHRTVFLSHPESLIMKRYLLKGLSITTKNKNYDLLLELLLCINLLKYQDASEYDDGLQFIIQVISANGFLPPYTKKKPVFFNNFKEHYHSMLMLLAVVSYSILNKH